MKAETKILQLEQEFDLLFEEYLFHSEQFGWEKKYYYLINLNQILLLMDNIKKLNVDKSRSDSEGK